MVLVDVKKVLRGGGDNSLVAVLSVRNIRRSTNAACGYFFRWRQRFHTCKLLMMMITTMHC